MPRDQLRILLSEHSRAEQQDMTGQTVSPVILLPYDTAGELMPTVHVQLNTPKGLVLVCHVPVAANNQELKHVTMGSPVRLKRSRTGRIEVVGLDKRTPGTIYSYTLNISTAVLTSGNPSALSASVVTFGALASVTSIGFGQTPFGAIILTNASGTIVAVT